MFKPSRTITRRTFLKMVGGLTYVGVSYRPARATTTDQTTFLTVGYGAGVYGQGTYAGSSNQVYLPYITKEQN